MILGADNQNQNLSKASSRRIDTSPRVKAAAGFSADVTSNKKTSSSSDGSAEFVNEKSSSQPIGPSPDPVRGSYEGLVSQSSGHIQMDGDGYDNPGFQTARYKKQDNYADLIKSDKFTSALKKSSNNNGIITNYSSRFNGNSIANKMADYLNTEKMFS